MPDSDTHVEPAIVSERASETVPEFSSKSTFSVPPETNACVASEDTSTVPSDDTVSAPNQAAALAFSAELSNSFIVIVCRAQGLRAVNFGPFGQSDPYCKISSPSEPALINERTEVIKATLSVYVIQSLFQAHDSQIKLTNLPNISFCGPRNRVTWTRSGIWPCL